MIVAPVRVVFPEELTVTAPPAPPAKALAAAATLPVAVTAPKLTVPPVEFSVMLPAARPTPVEVPPLVVTVPPDTLILPAVIRLTLPPTALARPVVVIPLNVVLPVPVAWVSDLAVNPKLARIV